MTDKSKTEKAADKETKAREDRESKRISPDHPLGTVTHVEEDFYDKQRKADPDGLTATERNQRQMGAPGALDQTAPDGEKIGADEDEAHSVRGTEQSS